MKPGTTAVFVGLLSLSCAGLWTAGTKAAPESRRLANLQRAAKYPWTDEGACAVREAAGEWKTLVERCFYALDLSRIRFQDVEKRCPVAQEDVAGVEAAVAMCLLVQPELAVGAIVVVGVVVAASAIAAEIEKEQALERRRVRGPCMCRCFGPWTPTGDPNEGNPDAGMQALDAECRAECVYRGFLPSNYTCL